MWIFLNDSFLSIVAHRDKPGMLLVRARKIRDIGAVFPGAQMWVDKSADYPCRAEVPAEEVAQSHLADHDSSHFATFRVPIMYHSYSTVGNDQQFGTIGAIF